MNEIKKNELLTQELCTIFRFIDHINSLMVVRNLKLIIVKSVSRDYSQAKKIMTYERLTFWI